MKLRLRPAVFSDARILWLWRNDKETRRSAFNTARIPFAGHTKWLEKKLADKRCRIFIGESDGFPVGQVRFDKKGQCAEVDVCVAPVCRGQGIGSRILRLAVRRVFNEAFCRCAIAQVKHCNQASVHAFKKAGFKAVSLPKVRLQDCITLSVRKRACAHK